MPRVILFGGKGGVGKTTCASAAAVQLADAGLRTLLLSTDPAHSLSDCLEQEIGHEIRVVQGVKNLSALEVSAERLFLQFKEEHGEEIKRILDTGTYLDEEDIAEIFSLSIPGLDEVMSLTGLVDLMEEGEYDLYILDTAPTGHALRLLALPELLDGWIKTLAKLRYKYHYVSFRLSGREMHDAADDLLFAMKRTVKRLHALLRDPETCEFVVVTIPQAMVVAETRRLIENLARLRIPLKHLIVNHLTSVDQWGCPFCYERWQEQRKYLQEIERSFTSCAIFRVVELPHQVKGIETLKGFPLPVDQLQVPKGPLARYGSFKG
jgi:arsenite-transporting ATPase